MSERFETFTTNISSIYKSILKIKKAEMEKIGLKGTHVTCMSLLNASPEGLTATEISALAKEDKGGISRALSELSEQGFVQYLEEEGAPDKRKYRAKVTLTDKGIAYAQKVNAMIDRAVASGGSDISDENRLIFYSVLRKIADNLENYYYKIERNTDHE